MHVPPPTISCIVTFLIFQTSNFADHCQCHWRIPKKFSEIPHKIIWINFCCSLGGLPPYCFLRRQALRKRRLVFGLMFSATTHMMYEVNRRAWRLPTEHLQRQSNCALRHSPGAPEFKAGLATGQGKVHRSKVLAQCWLPPVWLQRCVIPCSNNPACCPMSSPKWSWASVLNRLGPASNRGPRWQHNAWRFEQLQGQI